MDNKLLENYLDRLEKSLGTISVSEKAEIIIEIKSHIMDATENDPEHSTQNAINSLGVPEQVAKKYLDERGLEAPKLNLPKAPSAKWFVLGFLGLIGMFMLFILILVFSFTPFIKVDEDKGRVQILGGLIDINERTFDAIVDDKDKKNFKFEGSLKIGDDANELSAGIKEINENDPKEIKMNFLNGKASFEASTTDKLEYSCKTDKLIDSGTKHVKNFDFSNTNAAKCKFKVPKDYSIKIKAINAKFSFDQVAANIDLKATNGKIDFKPAKGIDYNYNFKITNGKISNYNSSNNKEAYQVKMTLLNGKINID